MSDHIRRMRALQRAKTAERLARATAEQALNNLAEFATLTAACIGRDDGLNDATNIDEFEDHVARARASAKKHADAYARLAEVQS